MQILTAPFWIDIENWPISWEIGGTSWFPFLESIHVLTAALVVGSILMVDLRLLGLAAKRYSVTTLSKELVPWSIGAFVIATITGLGMFITRAASHVVNPAFQWKMALLLLAGINMMYFHFRVYNQVERWNSTASTPTQVKIIGGLSLFLWSGVMLAGRWVGHII
ncbi:MAG: hypothetical protein HQ498_04100 [Pseudohongiella sp.]|jgi:hypothetical protein|nr:hypothetical protein [Pseudohongiella sp.]